MSTNRIPPNQNQPASQRPRNSTPNLPPQFQQQFLPQTLNQNQAQRPRNSTPNLPSPSQQQTQNQPHLQPQQPPLSYQRSSYEIINSFMRPTTTSPPIPCISVRVDVPGVPRAGLFVYPLGNGVYRYYGVSDEFCFNQRNTVYEGEVRFDGGLLEISTTREGRLYLVASNAKSAKVIVSSPVETIPPPPPHATTVLETKLDKISEDLRSLRRQLLEKSNNDDEGGIIYAEGTAARIYTEADPTRVVKRIPLEGGEISADVAGEIYNLYKLKHPNIVRFYSCYTESRYLYLSMEKSHRDLKDAISKIPFTDKDVKSLMHDLLSGLSYIHERGIIHRDLTPKNVVVDKARKLKIIDFGLSTIFGGKLTPDVTTLAYRSPEMMFGVPYTTAIDIWAAGCLFYEILEKAELITELNSSETALCQIFRLLGSPVDWSDIASHPYRPKVFYPDTRFSHARLDDVGNDLLRKLLAVNPRNRIKAGEALQHPYFSPPT